MGKPEVERSEVESTVTGRKFYLREILALVTGLHPGGRHFAALQEIWDFVPGKAEPESFRSKEKREYILQRYPGLADCEKDLATDELAILEAGENHKKIDSILTDWLAKQVARHGEQLWIARPIYPSKVN